MFALHCFEVIFQSTFVYASVIHGLHRLRRGGLLCSEGPRRPVLSRHVFVESSDAAGFRDAAGSLMGLVRLTAVPGVGFVLADGAR